MKILSIIIQNRADFSVSQHVCTLLSSLSHTFLIMVEMNTPQSLPPLFFVGVLWFQSIIMVHFSEYTFSYEPSSNLVRKYFFPVLNFFKLCCSVVLVDVKRSSLHHVKRWSPYIHDKIPYTTVMKCSLNNCNSEEWQSNVGFSAVHYFWMTDAM